MAETNLEPVSVESDGRILTGVDVTPESLQETIDARVKPDAVSVPAKPAQEATSQIGELEAETPPAATESDDTHERNADGTFKKVPRGQKRFDQLTREREDARREAQAEKTRREALEREVASLKAGGGRAEVQAQTQDAAGATQATVTTTRGPVSYPAHLKTFDTFLASSPTAQYEDWLEARADFRLEERSKALEQSFDARFEQRIEAERASRTVQDRVATSQARGRETYPDFDAVLAAATAVQFSPLHLQAIVEADDSEHLQYHLAKDPDLAARVAAEDNPIRLGRLLSQVAARAVAPTASTARPSGTTAAPAPIQPVGSSSKTTAPSLHEMAVAGGDDYDRSGYREQRASQLRAVRRR